MSAHQTPSDIEVPLPWEITIGRVLDRVTDGNPGKTFVEIGGKSYSYGQVREGVLRTASLFRELGVRHGDRVCLFMPNCVEYLYCWFGLSELGAISVPINTAYRRDETAYILNNAEAVALVTDPSLADVAGDAADLAPGIRHRILRGDGPAGEGWIYFQTAFDRATPLPDRHNVSPDDVSMLVYTSGTTGNPKGVMVTHRMYAAAGQGFAHWTQATPDDRFFTCLPFYHANIQYYSTMGALAAGATLVIVDRFSASRFWGQVRESQATVVNFIGMMMPVLAKNPEQPDDADNTVRLFYGSPSFSPEFLSEFQERFATDIIVGFGMTETCYGTIEAIREDRRAGSSGRPRQHPDPRFENTVRIADAETGRHVGPNTVGEITIKNPTVMPGYWRNDEQNRETLREGWLYTGDLGWLDDDGFLYFVDRKKDIIRRRGENISSQEVENVIKANPNVLDCAVVAVPSELGEDEVKAYVTPRPGATVNPEEVVYWCAEHLAYFKVPRYWEVRDELPRTPSLRVRKDVLRQEREDLIEGCYDLEAAGIRLR
ncbi:MAG: ATP-dependent acyl-CoA ligase [Chloroflexi bacterium]|nr:ATP-dependent acyl-CoA ligase [Chloroflexota bacterium]